MIAAPGQYDADTAHNMRIKDVLLNQPLIQGILRGNLHVAQGAGGEHELPLNQSLNIPKNAPDHVVEAQRMFNRIVDKNVPAINAIERNYTPESSIGNGILNLGWGTPKGVVLHEFGHHLEDNLSPEDFGTVHNFLRARSVPDHAGQVRERPTGYSSLLGKAPTGRGYHINMPGVEQPQTSQGNFRSILGLIGNGIRWYGGHYLPRLMDSNAGARGIEGFFAGHANNQQVGYSSMVYQEQHATEYLSTSIELLANPDTARQAIQNDPLRVCLLLYTANRNVYDAVRNRLLLPTNSGNPGFDLNNLIHKLGV